MTEAQGLAVLLCRVGDILCAIPLEHVVETMRPLPLETLSGAPESVSGMSHVRGAPLPVILAGRLLGKRGATPRRLVVVRTGERRVALAVDEVVGVRVLPAAEVAKMPPLLRDAAQQAILEIGSRDGELMVVLSAARVVADEVFALLEARAEAS